MMNKNYIIPYNERSVQIGRYPLKQELMLVDNIGLVVRYSEKEPPTKNDVRRHLICLQKQSIVIQADNLDKAFEKFAAIPQCNIGVKYKAWEIETDENNPVVEYSQCKHIRLKSSISCAAYDEPKQNGYMICVLDGLDEAPGDCPINKQILSEKFSIKNIGGIWIKKYDV